ncbi:MAG: hypothetical protein GXO25_03670 [Euryarchaeota archaeon]|nr:hypothetical protein [Euryarchaeota archaeon]
MKKSGKFAIMGLVILVLFSMGTAGFAHGHGEYKSIKPPTVLFNGVRYIDHPPIRINNNSDFARLGFPGNGTPENPYIISGLAINGSAGNDSIYIGNTTVYFVVENNYLYHAGFLSDPYYDGDGVSLYNVTNGIVRNNTLYNNEDDVRLFSAQNIQVIHNINTGGIGIEINASKNNTIMDNIVQKGGVGIGVWSGSEFNLVANNSCSANTVGMDIFLSGHNVFKDNTFINNYDDSIYVDESPHNVFYSNSMTLSGFGLWGDLENFTSQVITPNNTVNNKPIYYIVNQNGGLAPSDGGEIILGNVTNYTVKDMDLEYCSVGLTLGYSNNITVINNTFKEDHLSDILLIGTTNSTIENNQINSGFNGVYLSDSTGNTIKNNSITGTGNTGVYMELDSTQNMILNNTITDGGYGIQVLDGCNDNYIAGNTIANNNIEAIEVTGGCNTTIMDNTMYDSPTAINVGPDNKAGTGYGWGFEALHTKIYNNNMTNEGIYIHGDASTFYTMTLSANNTINGKPVYFFNNQSNVLVPANASEIIMSNVSNVSITNMSFNRFSVGIELAFSSNITVENCSFYNNSAGGIYIDGSSYVEIRNSSFLFNNIGLIMANPFSQHNKIIHNLFAENPSYSISIRDGSYNLIYNNSFYLNGGSGDHASSYTQASDNGYDNYWNTTAPPGGTHGYGNYWYDWANNNNTNDQNHDGIVDWPYSFNGNKDYYPLKNATYPMPPLPPLAPNAPQCKAGNGYVLITWRPPSSNGSAPLIEYRIYRNGVYLANVSANQTWYNDTDVVNGVMYYYYITAVNSVGESQPSTPTRGMPEPAVPELPNVWIIIALIALVGMVRRKIK